MTIFIHSLSCPRNKELIRIFKDLGMVEQLGSGVPRILRAYPKECFHFGDSFLRITIPKAIVEADNKELVRGWLMGWLMMKIVLQQVVQ